MHLQLFHAPATAPSMRFTSLNLVVAAVCGNADVLEVPCLSLLQTHVGGCATLGKKPFAHGSEIDCCPGLKKEMRNLNGSWTYLCEAVKEPCSEAGTDPYSTGSRLACCAGLQECEHAQGEGRHVCAETCSRAAQSLQEASCLCIFDIDRTLTAKQGSAGRCPGTRELDLLDKAYGRGNVTLSPLSVSGIRSTFCKECYLGIISSGEGSGVNSAWNHYILDTIMRTEPQDNLSARFPDIKDWSWGTMVQSDLHLRSPFVLGQQPLQKYLAAEEIRSWYERTFNFTIQRTAVHFFDDRPDTISLFANGSISAREVSCASRMEDYWEDITIGVCGAAREDIVNGTGAVLCDGTVAFIQM